MNEKQIYRKLNEYLNIVEKNYPVENVFGIFISEIKDKCVYAEAVVIPTFEQICLSMEKIDKDLTEYIKIFDIRTVFQATKNGYPELIKALYTDYIIINPRYEHIYQKLYKCNRESIKAGIYGDCPSEELKFATLKICRHCWNENSNTVRFLKQITDAEKLALDGIIKTIGDEGRISQAKVASAIGVSRLTMTNLVMKMKFCEIAKVEYLGQKGTYIKFLDKNGLKLYDENIKTYISTHGGGGAVSSVNGHTGAVNLDASDVNAMPIDTTLADIAGDADHRTASDAQLTQITTNAQNIQALEDGLINIDVEGTTLLIGDTISNIKRNYSTEEQIVGIWNVGGSSKIVYSKVIVLEEEASIPPDSWFDICTFPEVDRIINASAQSAAGTNFVIDASTYEEKIIVMHCKNSYIGIKYLVLYYHKLFLLQK